MKIVNLASGKSAWRGYDYFIDGNVISHKQISEYIYEGLVKGSENNVYNVTIDIEHPRKTVCNCPFANGKRVVCKHAVALYFAIFPEDAVAYKKQVDEAQEKYEAWQEELEERVEKYIYGLSKSELQSQLLDVVLNSGDWVYEQYVRDHYIDED